MTEILYRKWRPKTFGELSGQEHVATTLTNALASGRIAHAYLFSGPRGTGKTSTGRVLGKALNCTNRSQGEACNTCETCLSYLSGRAMDLIELDAASNRGIDEIRSLRDKVAFAPGAGEYKVYLIDEVHMLTDAAFNALLKTLEEPPPHVVFILATTDPHKVPPTIASRCQRFDFRRIPLTATVTRLQQICEGEGITAEAAALELIARSATGSLRDANNLLDQLVTSYGHALTIEHVRSGLGLIGDDRAPTLARLVLQRDLAGGLELIASARDDGLDLRQFQRELVEELRNLLLTKSGLEPGDGVTAERKAEMQAVVAKSAVPDLLRALRSFGEADLKQDPNSTLPLDIALAECILAGDAGQVDAAGREMSKPEPVAAASARPAPRVAEAPTSVRQQQPVPNGARQREPEPFEPGPSPRSAPPPPARPQETPVAARVAAGPVEPTLGAARQIMRAVFERTKARNASLGALLNGVCDIIEADEQKLVLGFKFPVHANRAAESANIEVLSAVIKEVMGRELSVSCVFRNDIESWKARESVSRSPLVRAAQEMGARVVSSDPEEIQ